MLTFCSINAGGILLTAAFTEQYWSIGGLQLFLGCISTKWEAAFMLYNGPAHNPGIYQCWSSLLIMLSGQDFRPEPKYII
jgi:hypothetical protein